MKIQLCTCALALLFIIQAPLSAQEAEVHGIITDTDGTPLIGATIRVVGSVIGASSDVEGHYQIEVPPGRIRLLYTYIGFENFDTTFRVRPDERDIRIDLVMPEAFTETGEVIVFGRRATGQAQALRNQQSALSVQTNVHSEVFNKYPDITMAETVSRLPGVSIIRDVEGGEIVQVRGLPEQFTAVDLNGQRLPTIQPEANQSGSLDIIQSNLVDEVRVIKARTADIDGDAIGGTVDFRVRQPEEKFEILLQGGLGNNFGFDNNPGQRTGITQLAGVLNSELSDEKVYALAAGTYFRQGRGTRTRLLDYDEEGNLRSSRPFDTDRLTKRTGFVGAIELRPSIYNRMRLSFNQSNVLEDLVQRQLLAENREFGSTVDRLTSSWRKERKLSLVALEVENNFGNTRLDYQLSFSVNQEDITDRLRYQFRGQPTQAMFSAAALAGLSITEAVSSQPLAPFNRLQDNLAMEEDVAIGSLNLTRYLNEDKNSFLRIGGRYRSKDRSFGRFSATLPWSSGTPADIAAGSSPPVPRDVFMEVPNLDTDALAYALKQRIAAGYAMYAANFTSQLSASVGLRYEYIEVETAETEQDTFRFNRNDLLPSINLTYRVRRDRQIRFSYYQALGRPNYATFRSQNDLILFPIDQYSNGNQDIRTTTSNNLDLTFERYGRRDGLITLGLYAKFLQNPTVRLSETRFIFDRATYHTTLINTESANLVGAEFGFFQNLSFLGGDFRFFNVNGNYNFNALGASSKALNFDSFTLPQAPRQTANLSIVCSNPNKGLSLVIAANYRDRIFDRVLDGRPVYRNALISLDFAADYEIINNFSIYLRANNLTDHSFEEWFGEPNDNAALLRSQANYGSWGVIGVRYKPGKN